MFEFCGFFWFLVFMYSSTDLRFLVDSFFSRHTFNWTFHAFFLNFIFFLVLAFSLSFRTRILFFIFLVFVAASVKSLRCLTYIRAENNIRNQSGERFTISRNGENWLLRVMSFSVYFAAAFITGSRRISSAAAAGSFSMVSSALSPLFFADVAFLASLLALWFTIILFFYWIFADCTRFIKFLAIFMSFIWLWFSS